MAKSFPDLTGDGKVTRADVLKGRGVYKKGGWIKEAIKKPFLAMEVSVTDPSELYTSSRHTGE